MSVMITISRKTYSPQSIISQIQVANSDGESFSGFALENAAPPDNPHLPVPQGSYKAHIRRDHDPRRIELMDVPNATDVQIHIGNTFLDVKGCFAVGRSSSANLVIHSGEAMQQILQIVDHDHSANIQVEVVGHAKSV